MTRRVGTSTRTGQHARSSKHPLRTHLTRLLHTPTALHATATATTLAPPAASVGTVTHAAAPSLGRNPEKASPWESAGLAPTATWVTTLASAADSALGATSHDGHTSPAAAMKGAWTPKAPRASTRRAVTCSGSSHRHTRTHTQGGDESRGLAAKRAAQRAPSHTPENIVPTQARMQNQPATVVAAAHLGCCQGMHHKRLGGAHGAHAVLRGTGHLNHVRAGGQGGGLRSPLLRCSSVGSAVHGEGAQGAKGFVVVLAPDAPLARR